MKKRVRQLVFGLSGVGLIFVAMAIVASRQLEKLTNRVASAASIEVSQEALSLHHRTFIADLHADTLLWGRSIAERKRSGHVDLPRLQTGGVGLQVFAVVTHFPLRPRLLHTRGGRHPDYLSLHALSRGWPPSTWKSPLSRAMYQARRFEEGVMLSQGQMRPIRKLEDLEWVFRAHQQGRDFVGGLLALEGAHALEGRVANLEKLYLAGFRMIGLAHFIDNEFAGSSSGRHAIGLTELGRQMLTKMQQLGMVPDLAHASARTIEDALALTDKPFLVSHTGLTALCPQARNLSDAEVVAIAETGGVVGIAFGEVLICGKGVDDIVASIRHVVDLAGVEHVALGSDYDGAVRVPFDVAGLPQLTEALLRAGFDPDAVGKILGGNVLRVLRQWLANDFE